MSTSLLRPIQKEDYEPISKLMEMYQDTPLFSDSRALFQKDIFFHYINKQHTYKLPKYFSIIHPNQKTFIGLIGLLETTTPKEVELVIVIDKTYYGQGFAQEALESIIDYAFNTLDQEKIIIKTDKENTHAIHFFEHIEDIKEIPSDNAHQCFSIVRTK